MQRLGDEHEPAVPAPPPGARVGALVGGAGIGDRAIGAVLTLLGEHLATRRTGRAERQAVSVLGEHPEIDELARRRAGRRMIHDLDRGPVVEFGELANREMYDLGVGVWPVVVRRRDNRRAAPAVDPNVQRCETIEANPTRRNVVLCAESRGDELLIFAGPFLDAQRMESEPNGKNRGMLWSVDANPGWIENTERKIPDDLRAFINIRFSDAEVCVVGGELCHQYCELPNIVPDFLYLDGPSPFDVKGQIRGVEFTMEGGAGRPPISADVLLYEGALLPGFLMVIDGRYSNMQFLKRHLKRQYKVR